MKRNKVVIAIFIVLIIALSIGAASAFSLFGKEDAKLVITGNDTLNKGDDLNITLTKVDGKPINNATISIVITGENGTNQTLTNVTNASGIAKFKIDKDAGSYIVNCTFAGDDKFNANNTSKNLTIKDVEEDVEIPDDTEDDDPGAFYSEQEGRVIYTGEIHEGPDGNRYRHMGYNEWQLVE